MPTHTHLRGVLLTDRWRATPPAELVDGRFDLIDTATGEPAPLTRTRRELFPDWNSSR